MSRWSRPVAPRQRTQADRERDCLLFCAQARIEAVRAISDEDLAARYGCGLRFAKYQRAMRLQREPTA